MKIRRILSDLLTVLGFAAAIGIIWIAVLAIHTAPVMLQCPDAAADRARDMMFAVCCGDYESASGMMYGCPNLGARPEDSSPAVELIWNAFLESLECDFPGYCYATDAGLAIDVNIRSLDVSRVIEGLDSRAQILLNQRIAAAEDSTEIYDVENNFRQELITEILRDATLQALEENKQYREQTISLHLIYERGEWWIMPDADLLNALSGSISG